MRLASEERQLALDLPHVEASALDDFLPAPSNRAALEAVLAWPAWPSPLAILDGPAGCGKTHLARIWAGRAAALYLGAAQVWDVVDPLARLGRAAACVIDDADQVEDERLLLHLYNLLAERRGSLLLTARRPFGDWEVRLPDLRSRLGVAWCVPIGAPAEPLLAALLVKQFNDRQLRVDPGVVELLARQMERSFATVSRIVRRLDGLSLRSGRPVGVALARAVLRELAEAPDDGDDAGTRRP